MHLRYFSFPLTGAMYVLIRLQSHTAGLVSLSPYQSYGAQRPFSLHTPADLRDPFTTLGPVSRFNVLGCCMDVLNVSGLHLCIVVRQWKS